MKITTADCIDYLVNVKCSYDERGDDKLSTYWKRRSKKSSNGSIIRIFENIHTGKLFEVIEKNGNIIAANPITSSPSNKSKYVFGWATIRTPDSDPDSDGIICVSLRDSWEKDGVGDDYLDEDVYLALEKFGVQGLDESHFNIPKGKKSEVAKAILNEPLLKYDSVFQRSLKNDVGDVYDWKFNNP